MGHVKWDLRRTYPVLATILFIADRLTFFASKPMMIIVIRSILSHQSEGSLVESFNVFNTKARVVMAFDPDHLQKVDKEHIARIVEVAIDLARIPGFRGCLPCAASGLDEFAFNSRVLPVLKETQG